MNAKEIMAKAVASRSNKRTTLQIVIDNTANGATEQAVSLFDVFGACQSTQNDDSLISTNYKGGIAGLRKKLNRDYIIVSEINYQVLTASTQFGKAFNIIDGGFKITSEDIAPVIGAGRRPANNDDKCRIIDYPTVLHGEMDWVITVAAAEKVTLLIQIEETSAML